MEVKTITIKDKKDGETKTVSYYMTDANVHIEDSYLIRSNETKKEILTIILSNTVFAYKRTIGSWLREWRAHNVLYKWGYQPDRTKSVDLNEDETQIRKIGYFLLSIFE